MVSFEDKLEKHFITELQTPQHKDNWINFKKKGNIQQVTVLVNGDCSKFRTYFRVHLLLLKLTFFFTTMPRFCHKI